MADGARLRVALLARAGEAREQLKRAITELGAELVVEADPNELALGALVSAGATTVLVSVEPAVEAALDRLEADLLAPALNVMYDEAETTARLSGWDQARWARHLAAKLMGCDVLPPGGEPAAHQEAAEHLVPGVPATPATLARDVRMADFAEEINASAAEVPSAYRPSDAPLPIDAAVDAGGAEPPAPAAWAAPPAEEGDPEHLDLDLAALEQAMRLPAAATATAATDATAPTDADVGALEVDELEVDELELTDDELAAFGQGPASRGGPRADAASNGDTGELEMDPDLARLAASFDENLDALSFEPAPSDLEDFEAFEPSAPARPSAAEPPPIPDFDFDDEPVAAPKPVAAPLPEIGHLRLSAAEDAPVPASAAAKPAFDFGGLGLELAPMDDAPAAVPPSRAATVAPQLDVGHLSLSDPVEDPGTAAAPGGLLLVLSGIGGPDAVRQMLRALPAAFPLAVLLQQNLDGGRHDRFVEQLGKISRLPVALAEPTETPPAKAVRVLPEGLSGAGALSFPKEQGVAALVAAASALDGAIVVLSGADEAAVEPVKQAMAAGTRVLVQDPASCFDAKAAAALRDAGAPTLAAGEIAARLDAFFPT